MSGSHALGLGHEWKENRLPCYGLVPSIVNVASHLGQVSPRPGAEFIRVASS
jgi:hypothetical protein